MRGWDSLRLSWLIVAVALAMVASACSGTSEDVSSASNDDEPTAEVESDDVADSRDEPTNVAGEGDDVDGADEATVEPTEEPEPTEQPEPTATPSPEPTATPDIPKAPLTGLPVDDPELLERPALMVKIDNSEDARPQVGLNTADQVLEILVEGITRLAMVFHAGESNPVGPVRSGRSSDPNIAANYGQPLFAWSGGNPGVTAEIRAADAAGKLYDVGAFQITDYYRDNNIGKRRFAPHNYFTSSDVLWSHAPEELGPPPRLFGYQGDDYEAPVDAADSPGVHLAYTGGVTAEMVWDEDLGGYRRWQRGTPHVDENGVQVAPPNVVVLYTQYVASQADSISPQAVTVGDGRALVLTNGHAIPGFWERSNFQSPWDVIDADGEPIVLTPGQTWILLPKPGEVTELTAEIAADLLATVPDADDDEAEEEDDGEEGDDADAEDDADADAEDAEDNADADEDADATSVRRGAGDADDGSTDDDIADEDDAEG